MDDNQRIRITPYSLRELPIIYGVLVQLLRTCYNILKVNWGHGKEDIILLHKYNSSLGN